MSSNVSLMYWNEKVQRGESRELDLVFNITGAKAATEVQAMPVLHTFDAFASQAVIDSFLGTTNEFLLAAFDATSMGADAFGGVINLAGQAKEVLYMSAKCYSGTGGATLVEKLVQDSSALTASTLATEVALGASGNIGFKVDFGNTPDFDALTAGTIAIKIIWKSK
jgi:hypothetical protein